MKRVLITGKNSYIGNSFNNWVNQWPKDYYVDKISVRDEGWEFTDWSQYDVLLHVAGIVHNSVAKDEKEIYYKVNTDLAYNIAKKAKYSGIKHFIFISTMSVYGVTEGEISKNSKLSPKDLYGKTKLKAEVLINRLRDEEFKISIIRPPMVYGKNSPGNYERLSKFAKKTLVFPKINNKRSMIYIDNLSNFLKILIEKEIDGIFCPQNEKYVNVQDMVVGISKINNKSIFLSGILSSLVGLINLPQISKVTKDLYYDKELSFFELGYHTCNFDQTIKYSEVGKD